MSDQAIFKNSGDAIVIIDASGQIEAFNPAAEKMFGYLTEDIVGKNVALLIPENARAMHNEYVVNADEHAHRIANVPRDLTGLRSTGESFPVELNLSRMEEDGQKKFLAIIRDVSERKRLEEQYMRLAVATRVMSEGILILNEDGTIIDMNPASEILFGYSRDELIGQQSNFLHSESEKGRNRNSILEAFEREGRFLGEINCQRKDGEVRIVEVSAIPILDSLGKLKGNVGINRDITDSKKEKAELVSARIKCSNSDLI